MFYLTIFSWALNPMSFFLFILGNSTFHSLFQFQFPLDNFLSNTFSVLSYRLSTLWGCATMFANSEFPLVYLQEPNLKIILTNPLTIQICNYSFSQSKYHPTLISSLKIFQI
jgi:hypothetical protein